MGGRETSNVPSAVRPGRIPAGPLLQGGDQKGPSEGRGGFHAKFGTCDCQVYVLIRPGYHLSDSNAYLGVAVKIFVDMVNLCVRLSATKTTTLHSVWAAPTQLKDFGRETEVSTRKEKVWLWTAVSAPGASSPGSPVP